MTITVCGVRHHGPGSARAVRAALDELRPSVVVIEGPPELTKIVSTLASGGAKPPIAALVYDTATPTRSSVYPLASFSPEWVALEWAIEHGARVEFADLPGAIFLAATPAEEETEESQTSVDIITLAAQASGYADPERWWEDAIEHRHGAGPASFAAVSELVGLIRAQDDAPVSVSNLRREAAIRKVLRPIAASGETAVVVCGAFHSSALELAAWPSATHDNKLLAGAAKTKVTATWVPWTSSRLSQRSGYGAGVAAPGWYEHLFTSAGTTQPVELAARWLSVQAREVRELGWEASPATVVEAVRFAGTLAALRGRPHPGLDELDRALVAVLCGGDEALAESVRRLTWEPDELGVVPEGTPKIPLVEDVTRTAKSLRLAMSTRPKTLTLDLRTPAGLAKSVLLHRLTILGVPWGVLPTYQSGQGTFKEVWELEWDPEFMSALIDASHWGSNVEAAAGATLADTAHHTGLGELADVVTQCATAQLPEALRSVIGDIERATATTGDVIALLQTVHPLAVAIRYGSVRGVDTAGVHALLAAIVTRASAGLPAACVGLSDEAGIDVQVVLDRVFDGLSLLEDAALQDMFARALLLVCPDVVGSAAGAVARLLRDLDTVDSGEISDRMAARLSDRSNPTDAASWLEAFIGPSSTWMVYDDALMELIDDWIRDISGDLFGELLPVLRRTFATFERSTRQLIANRVMGQHAHGDATTASAHGTRATALATTWLGLQEAS